MNRHHVAALAIALLPAGAAAQGKVPDSPIFKASPPAACAGCGVVSSVKRVEKAPRITAQERESTAGFVASVPIGGGQARRRARRRTCASRTSPRW